jgi:enamine deaminase RidA (YjgF/YER057c/UK114 family)
MSAEDRLQRYLASVGLTLPPAPEPKGLYRPLIRVGNLAYTAGHLPVDAQGNVLTGRLGEGLDVAAGCQAARLAGLGILATLRRELGTLDRVRRVVKLLGLVNSAPEFTAQPAVLNGCSELLAEVFGAEAGVGVRSAVGVNTLPLGAAVEIEAIFEIAPQPA